MNFLNPAAMAIAAGLTIPPLVALYFLKLKRVVKPVPSTLLWKRSVEDLQVNSPFQRLRTSLLLLLQLLVLIIAAIALGKPMFEAVQSYDGTIWTWLGKSVVQIESGTGNILKSISLEDDIIVKHDLHGLMSIRADSAEVGISYLKDAWHRQHDPDFLTDGTIFVNNSNMGLGSSNIINQATLLPVDYFEPGALACKP